MLTANRASRVIVDVSRRHVLVCYHKYQKVPTDHKMLGCNEVGLIQTLKLSFRFYTFGFLILIFLIREDRVVGLIPRSWAAPAAP